MQGHQDAREPVRRGRHAGHFLLLSRAAGPAGTQAPGQRANGDPVETPRGMAGRRGGGRVGDVPGGRETDNRGNLIPRFLLRRNPLILIEIF